MALGGDCSLDSDSSKYYTIQPDKAHFYISSHIANLWYLRKYQKPSFSVDMASVPHLPYEILAIVCDNLYASKIDISALCLVNKLFFHVDAPVLYRQIVVLTPLASRLPSVSPDPPNFPLYIYMFYV